MLRFIPDTSVFSGHICFIPDTSALFQTHTALYVRMSLIEETEYNSRIASRIQSFLPQEMFLFLKLIHNLIK